MDLDVKYFPTQFFGVIATIANILFPLLQIPNEFLSKVVALS